MATKLDRSEHSGVLITCTLCPYWFAFAWTVDEAHDSACNHEGRVHPELRLAVDRRARHHARHAAR